jgi:hypothetical protein
MGQEAKRSAVQQVLRPMRVNLLLIMVWLVAIALCIAVLQRTGDCGSSKTTWMGMLLIGCPN